MGAENRKKVNKERSKFGFGKGKETFTGSSFQKNSSKKSANKRNTISQLETSNLAQKKIIASLKTVQGETQSNSDGDDIEDAGNSF